MDNKEYNVKFVIDGYEDKASFTFDNLNDLYMWREGVLALVEVLNLPEVEILVIEKKRTN